MCVKSSKSLRIRFQEFRQAEAPFSDGVGIFPHRISIVTPEPIQARTLADNASVSMDSCLLFAQSGSER